MTRVKIIYIIGQLGRGGAERQLFELLKGINKDKYNPIVVSLSQGSSIADDETKGDYWADRIRELGLEIIQLPRKRHKDFSRLIKLVKIFRQEKPHIIHTYLHSANSYGRIAALFTRTPIIIASERSSYELGKNKKRHEIFLDKILASFSSGIICNSHNASKALIENFSFNKEKVYTVHNGVQIYTFSKKDDRDVQEKIVGMVANHLIVKNYNLFLNAAMIVLRKYKDNDLRFLTIGDGPLRNESKEYSKILGIENKVEFARSTDDVPKFLRLMDIFVSSSNYEGLSNAIMEAMAAGLPCVVTDVGGNSELVIDGKTGYIVPPNDPEALADKILSLLNNNRMAKEFGLAGKIVMQKQFNIGRMVKKTEEIYEKLVYLK